MSNSNYKHYISLGHFCSVAMELERIGLRETSSPFDWLISDLSGVISLIENNFEDFLEYDYLVQNKDNPHIYMNEKYKVEFYHDFDKYRTLKKQLPEVYEKYKKRIDRFYEISKEPTLFIRYIKSNDEIECEELKYIENHFDGIKSLLKSYNEDNNILFIANNGTKCDKIKIYNVEKDENDIVARKFLEKK